MITVTLWQDAMAHLHLICEHDGDLRGYAGLEFVQPARPWRDILSLAAGNTTVSTLRELSAEECEKIMANGRPIVQFKFTGPIGHAAAEYLGLDMWGWPIQQ